MKSCIKCNKIFSGINWKCPECHYEPVMLNNILSFENDINVKDDGFNEENYEKLFNLESNNFWFRSRNKLIIWAIKKYFSEINNFLEIGCGTGFVISEIEKCFPCIKTSASEIYFKGLQFASKRGKRTQFIQLNALKMPFREEFDLIGLFDVLEHINEDEGVLLQLNKACKKGGGIILTVPHHKFLWSKFDEFSNHVRRYSKAEIVNKVKKSGFKIIKVTSFVSILLPLFLISRLRMIRKNNEIDMMSEFKINSTVNSILEALLSMERLMIKSGISFPFGSSLLLLAKKE